MSTAQRVTLVSLDSQQRETGIFRVWFIWPILATTLGWGKTLRLTSSLLTPTSTPLNHSQSDGCLPSPVSGLPAAGARLTCGRRCSVRRMSSPWALLQQEARVSVNTPVPCPPPWLFPASSSHRNVLRVGLALYSRSVGGHSPAAPRSAGSPRTLLCKVRRLARESWFPC